MKKTLRVLLIILLIAVFSLCLFACGKTDAPSTDEPDQGTQTNPDTPSNPSDPGTQTNPDTPSNPSDPDTPGTNTPDTPSDPEPQQPVVNLTESYAKARAEFKAVTGVELPAIENITVEEFPYEEGATSYEVDITEGVTIEIFNAFVAFLDTTLASWQKTGPSVDGDYTNIWYAGDLGRIGITWDSHNTAVYVHAIMGAAQPEEPVVTMTESYANARMSFHTIMGIWLPELENCEEVFSWFDMDNQSLRFDFSGNADLFSALGTYLTDAIGQPLREDFWEYDDTVNGKEAKVNVEIGHYAEDGQYVISVHGEVRDYYTVTLTAGTGGSVTLKMGSRTFDDSIAKVNAGDQLILIATPDDTYEFVGWYDEETLISENNPYSPYQTPARNVVIQGKFQVDQPQHEHSFGEWTTLTPATCLQKGREKRVCACGEEETRDVEKTDHTYGTLINRVPATCTETGMEAHYECSVCHKLFDEEKQEITAEALVIAATEHDYNAVVTEPTCTERGYTTHTCSLCQDHYEDTYVNALGHDPIHHNAQEPTFSAVGWKAYDTCSRCDYSTYEEIPMLEMTDSYKAGRNSFHEISGIWLPEFEAIELDDDSSFDTQKKEALLIVPSNADTFASIVNAVKVVLQNEPLSDNNKHWEQEGFFAFWEWDYEADGRMHKVTIQLENNTYTGKVTVGYWFRDYYTITLTATAGGSVELDIAGRSQSGNTAHVCYNTSSDLIATVTPGYRFLGFYEEETLLSAENPYEGYMIVKDVTIEARFEEIPSNMTEGYKTARNNLYAMSGIVLPALEDVTTDHETYDFDDENHVRDEFNCDFTFASAEAAAQAFADFSTAIALVDGNAEESSESDAIWSKLYEDAVIPYRDDVMMFLNETYVFLMWRKQPIAFYNVTVEGEGGTADIVYTGADYEDVRVQRHWEIVDAFGGRIVATPAQGYEFDGWYVNGQLVSEDADYRFRLSSEKTDPVDFTEITFTAKFQELPAPTMTESYAQGRLAFQTITGYLLPELADCELLESSDLRTEQHTTACFDITGTTEDMSAIVAALTTQIEVEPYSSDASGTAWRYQYTDNGRTYSVGINTLLDTDVTPTCVYVNYYVQAYYEITVTAGSNGSVAMEHNEETVPGKQIATYADDLAVLMATPDDGYTFVGWFCNDEQISTDNPYYFTVEAEDAVIEARFVEDEEPEAEMTESYAEARTSFQTASGLLLPVLTGVNGMCEDLGANMWMVDISGATEDTLSGVIEAFDEQTGATSTIDEYGKNVWIYATSELSCFYNEGMVVIMYEEKQMSDSYAAAKGAFSDATGIILPGITDLDADIAFGETYVMFDIVGGENLTYDTYEQFLSYFDGINGWTGQEDEHSSESYPTYAYNNTTSGVSFQVVWNGESESGGIYLNVFNTLSSFDPYAAAKAYLYQRFAIDLPNMEGLSADFSCAADATWMTFDMTGENDFDEETYEAFVTALSAELGEGTDVSDEYQKRTTWTLDEVLWDVVWDLATGLAINFG